MANTIEPAKLKAATTYNAAADHFDDGPLAFWDRYGQRTIERQTRIMHTRRWLRERCLGHSRRESRRAARSRYRRGLGGPVARDGTSESRRVETAERRVS